MFQENIERKYFAISRIETFLPEDPRESEMTLKAPPLLRRQNPTFHFLFPEKNISLFCFWLPHPRSITESRRLRHVARATRGAAHRASRLAHPTSPAQVLPIPVGCFPMGLSEQGTGPGSACLPLFLPFCRGDTMKGALIDGRFPAAVCLPAACVRRIQTGPTEPPRGVAGVRDGDIKY